MKDLLEMTVVAPMLLLRLDPPLPIPPAAGPLLARDQLTQVPDRRQVAVLHKQGLALLVALLVQPLALLVQPLALLVQPLALLVQLQEWVRPQKQ